MSPIRMRALIAVWASLLPVLTWAQAVPSVSGGELGVLIYTPAERRELEQAREDARSAKSGAGAESGVTTVSKLTLDGFVRRTDGQHTAWVNGRVTPTGSRARHRGDFVVVRDASGRIRTLKPGQSIASDETVVRESFEDAAAIARARAGNAKPVRLIETTTETRLEAIKPSKRVRVAKATEKKLKAAKRTGAAKAVKKLTTPATQITKSKSEKSLAAPKP